ncbi:MAG TPA: NTP transferase domain-containing protein [Candidatus Limnocylindrales bacterium]
MTVAAVILFSRPEGALADAAGRPAARRIVESAWAGGATPIVVVAADPTGELAAALAGSPAVLAEPAPVEGGPVGQIVHGIRVATAKVSETDAAIVWPGRMTWVDAETVTTLIETHGVHREQVLRPRYGDAAGWPVLLPLAAVDALNALPAELMPDELFARLAADVAAREVDTGDPGTAFDRATPLDELPPYAGPPEPARPSPEWGAAAAEMPDDAPLEGPALAPYGQAADPESD